jgi:pimeloyl-ACP methyl ester carboxylesterase
MKSIYFFSGLGVDDRVFRDIDLTGFDVTFVQWITPLRSESIEAYSRRLSQEIRGDHPVLIGLSFGGMIAMEISKHIAVEQVILIASAKTKKEIPFYYRMAGLFRLHKLVPIGLLRNPTLLNNWAFGVKNAGDKRLFREILQDTDPVFLRWAINEVVRWKNPVIGSNVVHIHGTADKLLPFAFVKADIAVKGGEHFMTVTRSLEMTRILREVLGTAGG